MADGRAEVPEGLPVFQATPRVSELYYARRLAHDGEPQLEWFIATTPLRRKAPAPQERRSADRRSVGSQLDEELRRSLR